MWRGPINDDGVSDGFFGRVDKFDENDEFLFSFNAPGMASVMAIARDSNGPGDSDDTVWVTGIGNWTTQTWGRLSLQSGAAPVLFKDKGSC